MDEDKRPRLFDGEKWIFFDSDEEHKNYLASLPAVENPEQIETNKVDLIKILTEATPEEIQFLKTILADK